jgi:hypothetical protein
MYEQGITGPRQAQPEGAPVEIAAGGNRPDIPGQEFDRQAGGPTLYEIDLFDIADAKLLRIALEQADLGILMAADGVRDRPFRYC